jgi:hypothetical protein
MLVCYRMPSPVVACAIRVYSIVCWLYVVLLLQFVVHVVLHVACCMLHVLFSFVLRLDGVCFCAVLFFVHFDYNIQL